jgi:hypothetical protein
MSDDAPDRVQSAEAPQTGAENKTAVEKKRLSPAAERALAEAAARRAERERAQRDQSEEFRGRGGLDPVRYGDWEVKGIASDF